MLVGRAQLYCLRINVVELELVHYLGYAFVHMNNNMKVINFAHCLRAKLISSIKIINDKV